MHCQQAQEEFSALLDGELSPDAKAAVETHLAECADCLRALADFKRVDALYSGLPAHDAPEGFEERVHAAARPRIVRFPRRPLAHKRLWPLLAAAAAFIVILGGVVFQSRIQQTRFDVATMPKKALETTGAEAGQPMYEPEVSRGRGTGVPADGVLAEQEALDELKALPAPKTAPIHTKERLLRTEEVDAGLAPQDEMEAPATAHALKAEQKQALGAVGPEPAREKKLPVHRSPVLGGAVGPEPAREKKAPQKRGRDYTAYGYAVPKAAPDEARAEMAPAAPARPPAPLSAEETEETLDVAVATASPSPPPAPGPPPPTVAEMAAPERAISKSAKDTHMFFETRASDKPSALSERQRPDVKEKGMPALSAKTAGGHTFKFRGGVWYQKHYRDQDTIVLEPGSEKLRDLLARHPPLAEILALGERVVFRLEGKWYRVEPAAE